MACYAVVCYLLLKQPFFLSLCVWLLCFCFVVLVFLGGLLLMTFNLTNTWYLSQSWLLLWMMHLTKAVWGFHNQSDWPTDWTLHQCAVCDNLVFLIPVWNLCCCVVLLLWCSGSLWQVAAPPPALFSLLCTSFMTGSEAEYQHLDFFFQRRVIHWHRRRHKNYMTQTLQFKFDKW